MSLIPSWAPNVHPLIIHFPIVLVLLAVPMDVVHLVSPRTRVMSNVAVTLYVLGALSAVSAYVSGRIAAGAVFTPGMAHSMVESHERWATLTAAWLVGLAVVRLGARIARRGEGNAARVLFVALGIAAAILIQQTAERGARLVFEQGVGVIPGAVPEAGGTPPSGASLR
jgi:uncharacterized membrane protein